MYFRLSLHFTLDMLAYYQQDRAFLFYPASKVSITPNTCNLGAIYIDVDIYQKSTRYN